MKRKPKSRFAEADLAALEFRSQPITTRMPPIVVNYDTKRGRRGKRFDDPHRAKRFYIAKFNAGKNPTVRKVN